MTLAGDVERRAQVARQLDELLSGPLAANGRRATIQQAANFVRNGRPDNARHALWKRIEADYLARQSDVERGGRAALLTAGVPGAGKSSTVDGLGIVDDGWRRLDADEIKAYLIEDLVAAGAVDDVLVVELADGHQVLPAELAGLVHTESTLLLDQIRADCLRRHENVVVEGTLIYEPAAHELLEELRDRDYQSVTIVDVEVSAETAHEQALTRWWSGRTERITTGHGQGGRYTPAAAIDRAFTAGEPYSVCRANAFALFNSDAAHEFNVITLDVEDRITGSRDHRRRENGELIPGARPPTLPFGDTDQPQPAAQPASRSVSAPSRPQPPGTGRPPHQPCGRSL